jgi:elongation factor P
MRVTVDFYEGKPIGVTLPKNVDLRVTDTAPGLKTATVTNVLKPATTETGLVVPVPNFVDVGDVIKVDTESGSYLSRVKTE